METRNGRVKRSTRYTPAPLFISGAANWGETILVPGQLPNFRIYLCYGNTSGCHQHGMNERGSATIRYDTGGYQIIFGCRDLMQEWGVSLKGFKDSDELSLTWDALGLRF
jgi:hypothetical protein